MIFHCIFGLFGQNTSVPRVYVKPVTRDKFQKYINSLGESTLYSIFFVSNDRNTIMVDGM